MRPPWVVAGAVSQDPASYPYELYDLTKDWTQFDNVADKYPEKVEELEPLFWKGREVPGAAARCDGGHSARRPASQSRCWPHRVYVATRNNKAAE